MTHGIDAYFAERAHFARRVARTLVGVSVLLLGLQWGLVLVGRNPGAAESLRNLSMSHWGYEGAEQYVRRIELETRPGASSTNPGARAEFIPATRRGASHDRDRSVDPHARPVVVSARDGKGDDLDPIVPDEL